MGGILLRDIINYKCSLPRSFDDPRQEFGDIIDCENNDGKLKREAVQNMLIRNAWEKDASVF